MEGRIFVPVAVPRWVMDSATPEVKVVSTPAVQVDSTPNSSYLPAQQSRPSCTREELGPPAEWDHVSRVTRTDTSGETAPQCWQQDRFPLGGGGCENSRINKENVVHSVNSVDSVTRVNCEVELEFELEFKQGVYVVDTGTSSQEGRCYPSMQGRLRKHSQFWLQELQSSKVVADIVTEGYRLPLFSRPPPICFRNHSSVN